MGKDSKKELIKEFLYSQLDNSQIKILETVFNKKCNNFELEDEMLSYTKIRFEILRAYILKDDNRLKDLQADDKCFLLDHRLDNIQIKKIDC